MQTNEQTRSHECSACGGTGCLGHAGGWQHWRDAKCCDVCLGSGRIPDRVPVSDCLADAETLELFAQDFNAANSDADYRLKLISLICDLDLAERLHDPRGRARAAFRAVPGLRG